jgi:hypothetical protein
MKGWVYVVHCPEDWSNTAGGYNYQILDAPHVMEQNKNPQWECAECGMLVSGYGTTPPAWCNNCRYQASVAQTMLPIRKKRILHWNVNRATNGNKIVAIQWELSNGRVVG